MRTSNPRTVQNKAHVKIDASLLSNQNPAAATAAATSSPGGAVGTPPTTSSSSTAAIAATTSVGQKRKYHLRGADPLFARLRDSDFATVGPKLSKEILRLDSEYKV